MQPVAAGSRIDLPSRARPYKTASCVSGLKTCIFSGGAPARGSSHVFIGFQGCPIRLDEVRFGPEISSGLAKGVCRSATADRALSPFVLLGRSVCLRWPRPLPYRWLPPNWGPRRDAHVLGQISSSRMEMRTPSRVPNPCPPSPLKWAYTWSDVEPHEKANPE